MTDLNTRYERLLFAYPREYRRRRGAEIAATFTEMAAEGQRWPRGRDAVSLLFHGLRARLGRPRSRLIVPFTVLAMLVGGLCAAAGGACVGWGGSTGLSSRQVAEVNQLGPGMAATVDSRAGMLTLFVGYLSTSVWRPSWSVVGVLRAAMVDDQASVRAGGNARALVDNERARLAGTGWKITNETVTDTGATMTVHNGDLVAHLATFPTMANFYTLTEGSEILVAHDGSAESVGGPEAESGEFDAAVYRTTPATVPVFTVIAGLLGAMMTYLLIGWLSRRTSRLRTVHQRLALAGFALTAVLAAPAAVVCGAGLWATLRGHTDLPIRYWGGFATGDVRIAALVAAALLVLTIAGVALARPTPRATEAIQ